MQVVNPFGRHDFDSSGILVPIQDRHFFLLLAFCGATNPASCALYQRHGAHVIEPIRSAGSRGWADDPYRCTPPKT
jgi:hypothetical protein